MSYQASNLPDNKHFFFGATGGVSSGNYSSLNTNNYSLDKPEHLAKNLAIIAQRFNLKPQNLVLQKQGISNIANYITQPSFQEIVGDGLVTDKKDIILCIRTADCVPVLFADYENGIVGGSHAGWRGALAGVIENTLNLMLEKGAKLSNIKAAIGPCLQKHSFDAGLDMLEQFINIDSSFEQYFEPKNDKYLFDIENFVYDKLTKYGLSDISKSAIDTYTNRNYFSFRRSGHLKQISQDGDFPTQLSTITL